MTPQHPRSRARAWVLQILYGWDMGGSGSIAAYGEKVRIERIVSERYRPYISRLLAALEQNLAACDAKLEETMPNWRLERLSAIDRNILRIGTVEILAMPDVPPAVAIHEAVRLAERYGSADSPRFVNGVLDAVSRSVAPSS